MELILFYTFISFPNGLSVNLFTLAPGNKEGMFSEISNRMPSFNGDSDEN